MRRVAVIGVGINEIRQARRTVASSLPRQGGTPSRRRRRPVGIQRCTTAMVTGGEEKTAAHGSARATSWGYRPFRRPDSRTRAPRARGLSTRRHGDRRGHLDVVMVGGAERVLNSH